MLKKSFMKANALAMAMAAAFLLGGAAQAQQAAPGGIAGTTNPQDNIVNPAPMAGKAKSPEMRDEMAAKKAAKKMSKKPMRNKSMSQSSTNDMGATSAPGTQ